MKGNNPTLVVPCKRCGEPIVWASYTTKAGDKRRLPFNSDPSESGRYYLFHPHGDRLKLEARWLPHNADWPTGSLPREMHFKSCSARSNHPVNAR